MHEIIEKNSLISNKTYHDFNHTSADPPYSMFISNNIVPREWEGEDMYRIMYVEILALAEDNI